MKLIDFIVSFFTSIVLIITPQVFSSDSSGNLIFDFSGNDEVLIETQLKQKSTNNEIFIKENKNSSGQNDVLNSDGIEILNPDITEVLKSEEIKVLTADGVCLMPLDDYITCVTAAEMPITFEKAALESQSVSARTYTLYKMSHPSGTHPEADVCTDYTCCCAYISYNEAVSRWSEETADSIFKTIKEAVENTSGLILTYNGAAACAVFHSSSAGYTENASSVWGNNVEYLQSVETYENTEPTSVEFTEDEFTAILKDNGYDVLSPVIYKVVYNDSGRAAKIDFGDISISGIAARKLFGLRSCSFTLDFDNGKFIFNVGGYGHGVGLSQYGANEMAARGYDFKNILLHYYPGTEITEINYRDIF